MKKTIPFIACLLLLSCQYFQREIPSRENLLKQQLDSINWGEVDEMPSVPLCDTLATKPERAQCFIDFIAAEIQARLSADTLTVRYAQYDTLNVKVIISRDSSLQFEPQFPEKTAYDKTVMDSIIQGKLADFPKVSPALKRGLPVRTAFVLPVILNVTH
ncbi:hypothetical protein HYN48_01900 [Flavobacterium magnum]|uniref:TonB C-terminal domain-containing protein n=1 Tax=Flavobacterium magnum TaxID=2162713 RepID=A0A2S0RBK5_9FLAO|nr:hypothetical protein [Flavobacterium magnum]AWA28935.1 hypothetical protein HYN48_01900 [Flavobacterium magnum]